MEDQKRQQRTDNDVVHQDKKRQIGEWLVVHGTPDQQSRFAAGLLTVDEARDTIAAMDFTALDHLPQFQRDGAARLQAHLRQFAPYADVVITDLELGVHATNADSAKPAEWALMLQIKQAIPDATVTLRQRWFYWKRDLDAPSIAIHTVVVTRKVGLVLLRRELAIDQVDS